MFFRKKISTEKLERKMDKTDKLTTAVFNASSNEERALAQAELDKFLEKNKNRPELKGVNYAKSKYLQSLKDSKSLIDSYGGAMPWWIEQELEICEFSREFCLTLNTAETHEEYKELLSKLKP